MRGAVVCRCAVDVRHCRYRSVHHVRARRTVSLSRSAAPATRSTPRSWPARLRPPAAGNSPADGDDARRRRRQHLRLHRGGQEGIHRHAARPRPTPGPRSSPPAAWPSGTAASSPTRCPRPQVLSFDDYADIAARLDDVARRPAPGRAHPAGPAHAAADHARPSRPAAARARCPGRGRRGRRRRRDLPDGLAPGVRARASLRRRLAAARRAAEDRLRLRPALHVLRDPGVPRRATCPGRPPTCSPRPLAGQPGRQGAPARQRELHLLRQGPGRPAAAGDAAAASWPRSPASSGSGSATCSPPSCGPG